MAPYYDSLCKQFEWKRDEKLYESMKSKNQSKFEQLEKELKEANEAEGDTEVRNAYQNQADYYCQIGEKVGKVVRWECV